MVDCASTNTIAALLAGAADPAAAARLEVHLDRCGGCRRLVAELGRGLSAIGEASPVPYAHVLPQPGDSIARYQIKRLIGVGGMGIVYEAHDTTLDRGVALKLLRPDLVGGPSLLAEARAMARLQHPHIVAVHDAGYSSGRLYVCMELVHGCTLRAWVAQRPRDWRAIVGAFVAAGHGLAYVHRAGLVHLDFKPDNVLVDEQARVRVTDFGLSRFVGAGVSNEIAGTPAYMAPEQRRGAVTDARADQYAFCASLREALVAAPVPRWLERVLETGLAERRDDRFSTMDTLLGAIERRMARPRRRLLAGVLVLASGVLAALGTGHPDPEVTTRFVHLPGAHVVTRARETASPSPEVKPTPAPAGASIAAPLHDRPHPSLGSAEAPPRIASRAVDVARRASAPRLGGAPPLVVDTGMGGMGGAVLSDGDPRGDSIAAFGPGLCDDGVPLTCAAWMPTCPPATFVAVQQGCWTCADRETCAPLGFPRTCNDGTPLRCTRPQPTCPGHRMAAVRDGCWSCEDPFTCSSHAPHPSLPPPGAPPPPLPGDSGSGSGSGTATGCGNGFCEAGETHESCASDCCEVDEGGACRARCGNGFCEVGEDHASCAADCCELSSAGGCVPVCGNGFCEAGETPASCPSEC